MATDFGALLADHSPDAAIITAAGTASHRNTGRSGPRWGR
jgi:hypothetical protein